MDGKLLNKAGKNHYMNPDSVENVIRYAIRQRMEETREEELVSWGAKGCSEYKGAGGMIEEFNLVQHRLYTRKGGFGRYIDHEIYSFSKEEESLIKNHHMDVDRIARHMAEDFYNEGFQVVYGIHRSNIEEKHMHVHFVINTVNFRTGRKRRENKTSTRSREKKFQKIIMDHAPIPESCQ